MTDSNAANGQAATDSVGTTAGAPADANGSSGSTVQTTGNGSGVGAGESFFDPSSVIGTPLESAYKQMQAAWTKKMQEASSHRPKVEAYDAFMSDPHGTLQTLARQYGYNLIPPGAAQESPKDFNPTSWDEVREYFLKDFRERELAPLQRELRGIKKNNMTSYLDSKFPDWREHEGAMMSLLRANPGLVNDPDALYRAAVPVEVWESRAMQKAMQKLSAAGQSAQVSGGAKTTAQPTQKPSGPLSFDQAVEVARQRVASMGKGIAG